MNFDGRGRDVAAVVLVLSLMLAVAGVTFFNDPDQDTLKDVEPSVALDVSSTSTNVSRVETAQPAVTVADGSVELINKEEDIPVEAIETLLLTYRDVNQYLSTKVSVTTTESSGYSQLLNVEGVLLANASSYLTNSSVSEGEDIAKAIATWLEINNPNKTIDNAEQISAEDLRYLKQGIAALESEQAKIADIEVAFAKELHSTVAYQTLESLKVQYDTVGEFLKLLQLYKVFNQQQLDAVELMVQTECVFDQTKAFSTYVSGIQEGGDSSKLVQDFIVTSLDNQKKLLTTYGDSLIELQKIEIDPLVADAVLLQGILDARVALYTAYRDDAEHQVAELKTAQRAYDQGGDPLMIYQSLSVNWNKTGAGIEQRYIDMVLAVNEYRLTSHAKTLYDSILAYDDILRERMHFFATEYGLSASLFDAEPLRTQVSSYYRNTPSSFKEEVMSNLETEGVVVEKKTFIIPEGVSMGVVSFVLNEDSASVPQLFVGQDVAVEHLVYPHNATDYMVQTVLFVEEKTVSVYLTEPVSGVWQAQARSSGDSKVKEITFEVIR